MPPVANVATALSSSASCRALAGIELPVGAAAGFGDGRKDRSRLPIVAFLEHEHRHLEPAELFGQRDQVDPRLLAGVADKDHSVDLAPGRFTAVRDRERGESG